MSDRRFLEKLRDGARALISTRGVAMVNERPIVSFTFDGFAKSAALNAAMTLERRGAAGTFYASRHLCGATVDGIDYYDLDDLRRLVDNGHEIGSQTAGQVRAPSIGPEQLDADLEFNAEFIREQLGDLRMTTFAFPFGDIDMRTKLRMERALRGLQVDLAGRQRGRRRSRSAARRAPRFAIDGNAGAVKGLIERSARPRSWLIFYMQDVDGSPGPRGCTPALFEHALDSALSMGCQVLPVRNALGSIRFRAPTQRNSAPS